MRYFIACLFLVTCFALSGAADCAQAATYQVGPTRTLKKLQDVAPLLAPGDLVEVDGNATYPGDVIFTRPGAPTNKITIRGLRVNGLRPVLSGGTNTVEFRLSNHYVFEGFDVTGGTFRGIYHHAHDITVRDTVVHDCPAHGILGADTDSGSLTLEYVEVYNCGNGTGQHPVYMATDEFKYPGAVFRMQYCYLHDQRGGNNIKSRAERNEIYYNWISGGFYGEIELIGPDPKGNKNVGVDLKREDSDVVGNVFAHKATQGTRMARVGSDGTGETKGRYRFVNNTFILRQGQVSPAFEIFEGIDSLEVHNNVFYRAGQPAHRQGRAGDACALGGGASECGDEQLAAGRLGDDSDGLDEHDLRHQPRLRQSDDARSATCGRERAHRGGEQRAGEPGRSPVHQPTLAARLPPAAAHVARPGHGCGAPFGRTHRHRRLRVHAVISWQRL